jgi:hypothetical protein
MMEDSDTEAWRDWKFYSRNILIAGYSLSYKEILKSYSLTKVNMHFQFWLLICWQFIKYILCFMRQMGKMQDKRRVNTIFYGICYLTLNISLAMGFMILKERIFVHYSLRNNMLLEIVFNRNDQDMVFHHNPHMQSALITFLLTTIYLSLSLAKMENFNVNLNNSPNGSSAGSSEVSHEALLELCLVGTVLTDRPVRFQFMEERLPSIWRPGQGVTITQAGENRFHFQFYHEWDVERVLQNGPWTFEGFLLVLKKLEIGEAIAEVQFNKAEVWVQVFNLPHGYMNEYVGMLIGCHIGRFVKYDESNYYGPWRMYMRIRVALNIAEPLRRSMVLEKEDGTAVNVSFKYERLGVFCYICGIMGHTDSFCPRRLEPGYVEGVQGWGRFLNAGGRTVGGNVTVNKWLRGGRMAARGGRTGGRGGSEGINGPHDLNENHNNVVVMEHSSEHTLFGRVRILHGGGFTFHRMVTTIIGHNGGGEGQWVPFQLNDTNIANQITIRRLVNGLRSTNGSNNIPNGSATENNAGIITGGQQREQVLTGNNFCNDGTLLMTGCNQRVGQPILSICGAGSNDAATIGETSEAGREVYAKKKEKLMPTRQMRAGPLVIREGANNLNADNQKEVPSNEKGKGKMEEGSASKIKKRVRINTTQAASNNAGGANEQVLMNVDTVNEGDGVGGNFISVQNNPLFSENIVMAEADDQPRQQP